MFGLEKCVLSNHLGLQGSPFGYKRKPHGVEIWLSVDGVNSCGLEERGFVEPAADVGDVVVQIGVNEDNA